MSQEVIVCKPTFSAPVVYVQPEYEELKRRFHGYVDPSYEGKHFDPIERCKAVWDESRGLPAGRQVAFEYVHMDHDALIDEVLAEMDRKCLRPALYEELLSFAEKYPDEQRKLVIYGLGSELHVLGGSYVACLWGTVFCNTRRLSLHWRAYRYFAHRPLLAVRR
jgi:hypothetical protein